MNIFSTITARTMRQNRTRTVVTIIGVILSTAMITAVAAFGQSFWSFLLKSSIEENGSWYGMAEYVSDSDYQSVREDSRVEKAAAMNILGYARLDSISSGSGTPYIYVKQFTEDLMDMFPVRLAEGRMPENEKEILIPAYLEANQEPDKTTEIGDVLTLEVGDRMWEGERLTAYEGYIGEEYAEENQIPTETLENTKTMEFTVVGIISGSANYHYGGAGFEAYAGPSADGGSSPYQDVYIRTHEVNDIESVLDSIPCDKSDRNMAVIRWLGASYSDNYMTVLIGMLAVVIIIIMAGSISLIYNAFSISLRERTAQFGLLSSVGATKKQLRKSLRYEAFFVSGIGIPAGCLCGIAGIGITLHFIGKGLSSFIAGSQEGVKLEISWIAVAAAAAAAFFTVMISVWIPCRRIRKISPIAAIRSSNDIRIHPREVKTPRMTYKIFGLEGMMAEKNYGRDRKKYRSTVASLTLSIVLFTSVSVYGQYLMQTGGFVLEMPDVQIVYDIYSEESSTLQERAGMIQSAEKLAYENVDVTLAQPYGIAAGICMEITEEEIDGGRMSFVGIQENEDGSLYIDVFLTVLPDELFEKMGGTTQDTGALPVLYPRAMSFYNTETGRYEKMNLLQGRDGTDFEIRESEYDDSGNLSYRDICRASVLGSYDELPKGVTPVEFSVQLLTSVSGYQNYMQQYEEEAGIQMRLGIQCGNHIQTYQELIESFKNAGFPTDGLNDLADTYEQDRQILTAISVLAYGFIILISLISVANVFNTISTNLMLRRKEFAMLRSVGMSGKGFRKMMCCECLIYGLRSIAYGVVLSLLTSLAIFFVIMNGADTEYIVPWKYLIISVICVFAVVSITMVYTMGKIRRENIIEELKMN